MQVSAWIAGLCVLQCIKAVTRRRCWTRERQHEPAQTLNPNTSGHACNREVTMEEVLDEGSGSMELGTRDIVASVMLPAARSGDVFWSHRVRTHVGLPKT